MVEEVVAGPLASIGGGAQVGQAKRRVAVLVVHGMGQQVQFETLSRAAQGIARDVGVDAAKDVHVRAASVDGVEVRRAEVTSGETEIHVYEGYWAPHTEGNVTLRDVVSFLVRGAWNGLRNARSGYTRFAFGQTVTGKRSTRTMLGLGVAVLVLASLAIVDLAAVAIAASKGGFPEWLPERVLTDATWAAVIFAGLAVALPFYLASAARLREMRLKLRGSAKGWSPLSTASWVVFALTLAALVACALAIVGLALYDALRPEAWPAGPFVTPPPTWLVVTMWGGLLVASIVGRQVFVQYVGDVAAYVSPQVLDRFSQIRKEIKDSVRKTATAIYAAKDESGKDAYERIAIVGHSLGSVVAYDTLNGLLREDELSPTKRRVRDRTKLLLTFGSPLDKTAFIFATSPRHASATREALAALSQPLILDAALRSAIKWVNVHSKADPVSGALDLYGPVENVLDADATTPLLAHNEYWDNKVVWERINNELLGRAVAVRDEAPKVATRARR